MIPNYESDSAQPSMCVEQYEKLADMHVVTFLNNDCT